MKNKKIILVLSLVMLITIVLLSSCGEKKERVVIYTAAENYRIEYLTKRLNEQFPQYDIKIEYMSTGNLAAKLKAEGSNSKCDIVYDLEYGYMTQLDKDGIFAPVGNMYDKTLFLDEIIVSNNFLPEYKNGGAIIVNRKMLEEKSLPVPTCYEDLLKPEYKNLISMPNPKTSGTGYMFVRALVNSMGEDNAFEYLKKLSENILEFTSSGSGPVENLSIGETAIAIGMTSQAVMKNSNGANFDIIFFDEGSPYCMYGQTIISGKEEKTAVKEVFDFMINVYSYENLANFTPEKIYKDKEFVIENYPADIKYADMSNDTPEEKERLLGIWDSKVN